MSEKPDRCNGWRLDGWHTDALIHLTPCHNDVPAEACTLCLGVPKSVRSGRAVDDALKLAEDAASPDQLSLGMDSLIWDVSEIDAYFNFMHRRSTPGALDFEVVYANDAGSPTAIPQKLVAAGRHRFSCCGQMMPFRPLAKADDELSPEAWRCSVCGLWNPPLVFASWDMGEPQEQYGVYGFLLPNAVSFWDLAVQQMRNTKFAMMAALKAAGSLMLDSLESYAYGTTAKLSFNPELLRWPTSTRYWPQGYGVFLSCEIIAMSDGQTKARVAVRSVAETLPQDADDPDYEDSLPIVLPFNARLQKLCDDSS